MDSKSSGVADIGAGAGGADEGFGGHATDVEAVSAHEVLLDQRDLGPKAGRARRGHQAGRPSPDDHQVVASRGLGVLPIGRVRIRKQPLVVLVEGLDDDVVHCPSLFEGSICCLRAERAIRVT